MKIYKLAFTYVGAIVGAGFASGQEILRFFVVFGEYGVWGGIIACFLFILLGSVVVLVINKLNIKDYGQLLENIFPEKLAKIMDIIITLVLWLGLGVMLIGGADLLNEVYGFNKVIVFLFLALLIGICLWQGEDGLLEANSLLIPVLILSTIFVCLFSLARPLLCILGNNHQFNLLPNWWIGSFLYVFYNMIIGIVILSSLKIDSKDLPIEGVVLGGLILGFLIIIMIKSLLLLSPRELSSQMPMLTLSFKIGSLIGKIYSISLMIALFTTALGNAFALCNRLNNRLNWSYQKILMAIILTTLIFIPFNFSFLVKTLYPIEGYLGIPLVLGIVFYLIKFIR